MTWSHHLSLAGAHHKPARFVTGLAITVALVSSAVRAGDVDCLEYERYVRLVSGYAESWQTSGFALSGASAFVTDTRDGLRVLNVSDPVNPTPVTVLELPWRPSGVAIAGDHLYVSGERTGIVDVSDPTNPLLVAEFDLPRLRKMIVHGENVYAVDGDQRLVVIDVSDLASPHVRSTTYLHADDVELVISDGVAYLAYTYWIGWEMARGGLLVCNISNPDEPRVVASIETSDWQYGLAVTPLPQRAEPGSPEVDHVARVAYISGNYGTTVIDVTDIQSPRIVNRLPDMGFAGTGVVEDGRLYVASSGVRVFDVTDITSPRSLAHAGLYLSASGHALTRPYFMVLDRSAGLFTFDVTSSTSFPEATVIRTRGSAESIAASDDIAVVQEKSDGIEVFRLSEPAGAVFAGHVDVQTAGPIALAGGFAYVADRYDSTLIVIDVREPGAPVVAARIGAFRSLGGLAVGDDFLFLADTEAGLHIVDVSNPNRPRLVRTVETTGLARDVAVRGSFAFVAVDDAGLQIIDVSSPHAAHVVKTLPEPAPARAVNVRGDWAYVATGRNGLVVVDASVPEDAVIERRVPTAGYAWQVLCHGGFLVVREPGWGAEIMDATDPSMPRPVGSLHARYLSADGVAVGGGRVFLASGSSGLRAFPEPCVGVTPVILESFDLLPVDHGVQVDWRTENEVDILGFEIRRGELDHSRMVLVTDNPIPAGMPGGLYRVLDADVTPDHQYRYVLEALDVDGVRSRLGEAVVSVSAAPAQLALRIGPNPSGPFVSFGFDLAHQATISLDVYDLLGRRVRGLTRMLLGPGSHHVGWNGLDDGGRPVGPGVYITRLDDGARTISEKLVWLK